MLMMQHLGKILEWIPQHEGQEEPCHTSAVLLAVGWLYSESARFALVSYRDQSSNQHTGYPRAMRSSSQVLESNVLREQCSSEDAARTQMELAFDSVLDRSAGAAPSPGPRARRLLGRRLRQAWEGSGRWRPDEETRQEPT